MTNHRDLADREVVIFDFDGTVADTKASIISTATTVLRAWGVDEESLTRIEEIIGPPFPQAFEDVFGLSHDDAVEVTRRYRDIYNYLGVESWPAFPGMTELLVRLRAAGKRLAIASSKRSYLVEKGLKDNGIDTLFDSVCAKLEDGGATKVDCIRKAMHELGADQSTALMVGDRFHDVDAATACGIPCVGVLYGQTADWQELEQAGAVAIARSVDELGSILLG